MTALSLIKSLILGLILASSPVMAEEAPLSLIGIIVCKVYLGAYVIPKDGSVRWFSAEQLPFEVGTKLAETMEDGHAKVSLIPCPGIST